MGEGTYGGAFDKHLDIAIEAQDGPKTKEADTAKSSEADKSSDSTSGTSNDSTQQQPNKETKETQQPTARAKDLTITENGQQLVVRGGAERRFYEQREIARQQADTFKQEAEAARTEARNIQEKYDMLNAGVERLHGADARTVAIGVQMVSDLQRDPVGTMKKLLAEVTAQGYKIEELGAGVDTAAIQRMIDERLPRNTQTEQTDEEILAEATAEANQFFNRFPDARVHDELLARVMRDYPGTDLHTAYFNLKSSFADKGFDWSRSLEDNIKDTRSHSSTDNAQTNQNTNQQKPLPNGRAPNADEFKLDNGNGVVHEDTDTSEIVRQAMRESGMNI